MRITLDTSALIAVITNEPSKGKIVEISNRSKIFCPISVHWEIGNAFSAMLKRDRINIAQAQACIQAYEEIPIKFIEVSLVQTLELVNHLKIYAYDAYLIQCAQQLGTPLLTLDKGLMSAAQSIGVKTLEV